MYSTHSVAHGCILAVSQRTGMLPSAHLGLLSAAALVAFDK